MLSTPPALLRFERRPSHKRDMLPLHHRTYRYHIIKSVRAGHAHPSSHVLQLCTSTLLFDTCLSRCLQPSLIDAIGEDSNLTCGCLASTTCAPYPSNCGDCLRLPFRHYCTQPLLPEKPTVGFEPTMILGHIMAMIRL